MSPLIQRLAIQEYEESTTCVEKCQQHAETYWESAYIWGSLWKHRNRAIETTKSQREEGEKTLNLTAL